MAKDINKIDSFSYIGSYQEKWQLRAAYIAESMNLPFYSPLVVEYTKNKLLMRDLFKEKEVDTIAYRKGGSQQDIVNFFDWVNGPIIIKPLGESSSKGISKINSKEEIISALSWLRKSTKDKTFLMEEYLEGPEYSVEGFFVNGKYNLLCITDKYKESAHFVEEGHLLPLKLSSEIESQIVNTVINALGVIGVNNGPTHTEIILSKTGPKIVETHLRLGGDFIPLLIEKTTHLDLLDLWARQSAGEEIEIKSYPSNQNGKYASIWFVSPNTIGELIEITGLDRARKSDFIVQAESLMEIGSSITEVKNSFSRGAYVVAVSNSSKDTLLMAKEAAKLINFKTV